MKLKILCGLLAGLAVGSAGAAEPAVWSGEIVPSLWVAGLSGDGTVAGHDVDFNRSFGDVQGHRMSIGSSRSRSPLARGRPATSRSASTCAWRAPSATAKDWSGFQPGKT